MGLTVSMTAFPDLLSHQSPERPNPESFPSFGLMFLERLEAVTDDTLCKYIQFCLSAFLSAESKCPFLGKASAFS
jgi:hypothetical protein